MAEIKERINLTISNLTEKRDLLQAHLAQYKALRTKLDVFESYEEDDKPEIKVNITPIARVNAHIINPRKILALLGADYLVERDPIQAIEVVERKIKYLNQTLSDFNNKIKEAKKTMRGLDTLIQQHAQKSASKDPNSGQIYGDDLEEEGFPFMEIREELDEDGNVISSSIKESQKEFLNELNKGEPSNAISEDRSLENDDVDDGHDEIHELLHDLGIKPLNSSNKSSSTANFPTKEIPNVEEITDLEDITNLNTQRNKHIADVKEAEDIKGLKISGRNEVVSDLIIEHDLDDEPANGLSSDTIIEKEIDENVANDVFGRETAPPIAEAIVEREVTKAVLETIVEKEPDAIPNYPQATKFTEVKKEKRQKELSSILNVDPDNEFFKLFKQMKIIDFNTHIPEQIEQILKSEQRKTVIKDYEEFPKEEAEETNTTIRLEEVAKKFTDPTKPALDMEDILQLQIISDEIDVELLQDGEDYEEEGVYDRSYYYQDDDDDDDDEEYDEYYEEEEQVEKIKFVEEIKAASKGTMKIEEVTAKRDSPEESKTPKSIIKKQTISDDSKSVSFSTTVEIKEIENISEQLKNASEPPSKVSKFKQRVASNTNYEGGNISIISTARKIVPTFNGLIVEKDVAAERNVKEEVVDETLEKEEEEEKAIQETVLERDTSLEDKSINAKEPQLKPRLSKFMQNSVKPTIPKATPSTINDTKPKASSEFNKLLESDSKPLKLSKFKQAQLQANKNTATVSIGIPTDRQSEKQSSEEPQEKDEYLEDFKIIGTSTIPPPKEFLKDYDYDEMDQLRKYIDDDEEDDEDGLQQILSTTDYNIQVYTGDEEGEEEEEDNEYEDDEDDSSPMIYDKIIENEEVEDPLYAVDDNLIEREYRSLRQKMFSQYGDTLKATAGDDKGDEKERIIALHQNNGQELEPIDEHGNPVKVSRFRKTLNRS